MRNDEQPRDRVKTPSAAEDVSSAARYRSLVLATGQIVWTNSPNGQMLGEQPSWAAFTGQSFEEYHGFNWASAVHPDDRQPTIDAWNSAVATRSLFAFEHRVRRSDGEYRRFTIRAVPVFNEEGSIREWVGIHSDITDRRESEKALRLSEERYRLLAELLPVLVWTAGPDGTFDYVSPAFVALAQKPASSLMNDGWHSLVHPSDFSKVLERWKHAVQEKSPYEVEARLLSASDQRYRWHRLQAVPMSDSAGSIIRWIGAGVDIDDQRRITEVRDAALAQVKAERERLTQIIMSAPSVMALYRGPDYVIDMVNPMWETFVGKKNVVGRKVRDVFPELEGQGVLEILDRVRDSGERFKTDELTVMLDRKDDGTLEKTVWRVVFQPLFSPKGAGVDIMVHAVEITELAQAGKA